MYLPVMRGYGLGRRGGFWGLNRFNGGGVGSATGRGSSSSSSEGVEYALHRRSMADLGLMPCFNSDFFFYSTSSQWKKHKNIQSTST